ARGRSRRARSAHRPDKYLNRLAVASPAPSMIPSASALPPIATRNAGRSGTTISLETSPRSDVIPSSSTFREMRRRLFARDARGNVFQDPQRRPRVRWSFGARGVDSMQRCGERARDGVEVAHRQVALGELAVAGDLLDRFVDQLLQRGEI